MRDQCSVEESLLHVCVWGVLSAAVEKVVMTGETTSDVSGGSYYGTI